LTIQLLLGADMTSEPPPNILEGKDLSLRCREIQDISSKVFEMIGETLRNVASSELTYTFKSRLKGATKIHDKVKRKRLEGIAKNDPLLLSYNPDHVTDAWACRYVTLYQTQIPHVAERLLAAVKEFNADHAYSDLLLSEFVIYTNRPQGDPLSIVGELMRIFKATNLGDLIDHDSIIKPPENKKSAYSSVHLVFSLPLVIDFPGRLNVSETGKFEVQIRDIFEEGWGEIQHNLIYSRKDALGVTTETEDAGAMWKPHLNALKTFVDGCSQHASIIKANYEFVRLQRSPSHGSSATSRQNDLLEIIAKLRTSRHVRLIPVIELAYELLIEAAESDDRDISSAGYLAAASKFEEAIVEAGKVGLQPLKNRGSRTIEYFLKLELANCYLFAREKANSDHLRRAQDLCMELASRYQRDAVVRFRLAQTVVAIDGSAASFSKAIELMEGCIALIPRDAILGDNHWMQLSARIQLGFWYWRWSNLIAVSGDPTTATDRLAMAVKFTREALDIWEQEPEEIKYGATHALFAHKAVANILYYSALLEFKGHDRRVDIADMVKRFHAMKVPKYAEFYKSRDSLMHAYWAIGDTMHAVKCAIETQDELIGLAELRASKRLGSDEIKHFLKPPEQTSYGAATRVIAGESPFQEIPL
jgi:ppGpp synthetase/RelA/SpoT-type nucleotidyltranferase